MAGVRTSVILLLMTLSCACGTPEGDSKLVGGDGDASNPRPDAGMRDVAARSDSGALVGSDVGVSDLGGRGADAAGTDLALSMQDGGRGDDDADPGASDLTTIADMADSGSPAWEEPNYGISD